MDTAFQTRVHRHIEEIMPLLERPAGGKLPHPFIAPSYGTQYGDTLYCWDCHHMNMRFALAGRPEYLKHAVDNLLHHQAGDGYVPNVVSRANGPLAIAPAFQALPFLMQGSRIYVAATDDVTWLETTFTKLEKYLAFYETELRAPHGLFRWKMPWMSGIDNDVATTFRPPGTVIPVDLNAWMYLEYLAASGLAGVLGQAGPARDYAARAQALRQAVDEILWLEEEATYAAYDLCESRHMFHCVHAYASGAGQYAFQSCSNLIPLYARLADRDKAARMLEKYVLSDDHFMSPYGIRSLSRASDYYNNAVLANPPRFGADILMTCSNWQGPVWIPLCYFMFNALLHYGYSDAAADLAERTLGVLALALETAGSFAENYDAETGKPLYCRKFASWNILADTMHEQLRTGTWIMDPVFASLSAEP